MEHTGTVKSIFGSILTATLAIVSHITKEDFLVYVSILTGIVTILYTLHRWVILIKEQKEKLK